MLIGREKPNNAMSTELLTEETVIPYLIDKKIVNQDENPEVEVLTGDRKSTRLNSSHIPLSRMPSSA